MFSTLKVTVLTMIHVSEDTATRRRVSGCVDFGFGAFSHERRSGGFDFGHQIPYRVRFEGVRQHEEAIAVPRRQLVRGQALLHAVGMAIRRLGRRTAQSQDRLVAQRAIEDMVLERPRLRGEGVWYGSSAETGTTGFGGFGFGSFDFGIFGLGSCVIVVVPVEQGE